MQNSHTADLLAPGYLNHDESSEKMVRRSVSLKVLETEQKSKRKLSSAQVLKKKNKEWQKFLHFCRANPEAMMSLMEKPAPQYCDMLTPVTPTSAANPSRNLSPHILDQSRSAVGNYSSLVTAPASSNMRKQLRTRPQSGRPKPSKISIQARYDLPRDFKNEPFKVPKYSFSKGRHRDDNFSPAIEKPSHKFKGEVSSIGNQSDSHVSPDKSNQWETINKLGSDDVMI